jgi:hypothetical protein
MRGVTAGACNLSVQLSSATGQVDPSWHIAPPVAAVTLVERLEFDPYEFLVGGNSVANGLYPGNPVTRVAANPKLRELHQHSAANDFTLARVPIRRPTDAFWGPATHLTLTAGANVQIFADAAATAPAVALQQGDFAGAEYDLWVKTTIQPAIDAAPTAWAVRNPVKVMTRREIFCGATTGGRQLLSGDIVAFDTFSFDQQLDRTVGNATAVLQPLGNGVKTVRAALAMAAGHKYYNQFSGTFCNHQHNAPPGGLRTAFINAMPADLGNHAARARAGTEYVRIFLQISHAIALHAAMIVLLEAHILRRLNATGANLNTAFPQAAGTPGTHAEVLAVNSMLAAGLPAAEISVATYKLHPSAGQGMRFVACANCSGILVPHVRVITG